MFLNSLCILLHLCFHRKHTANPGRLPDSQIYALHAPSHSIYAAMVFACGLPAHSDRIVRESHPISYYPDRTYSPARHLNQLMKLYKKLYHFLQGCRNRVLLFARLNCLVFGPYAQWVLRSFIDRISCPLLSFYHEHIGACLVRSEHFKNLPECLSSFLMLTSAGRGDCLMIRHRDPDL